MTQPDSSYRNAPRLRSSETLDRAVLGEAKRRAERQPGNRNRLYFAPALATVAVCVVGVTMVLKNEFPSVTAIDSAGVTEDVSRAESVQQEFTSALASQDAAGFGLDADAAAPPVVLVEPPVMRREVMRQKSNVVQNSAPAPRLEAMADSLSAADAAPAFKDVASISATVSERESASATLLIAEQPLHQFTVLIRHSNAQQFSDMTIPTAIVRLRTGGQANALVIGSFMSRQQADKAISQLRLAEQQPRVLTFGALKKLLR